MSIWRWQAVDPDVSGTSGDLAKLFRHETIRQPGILSIGAPAGDATLLVREVIQNSWDAARALRSDDPDAPDFEIEFRFRNRSNADACRLIDAAGLAELAARAQSSDPSQIGLGDPGRLERIIETGSVDVLEIVESGTTGMYGPWRGKESKLYLAMVSLGFTNKATGAGGSYGYGKAGLIRGSSARTVFAYTCFRERGDDPGVTRRLLGMTYWGPHLVDGVDYSGFGRLGVAAGDRVTPLENDAADAFAVALGIEPRDPDEPEELGTTFLLVEPTVSPGDLVTAIERNWWPALTDPSFGAVVLDPSGTLLHPRPRRDPVLRSFIRAHEIATIPQDNSVAVEKKTSFHRWAGANGEYSLGTVGLVADPTDWSYPADASDPEREAQPCSLVALVRGPQMVVEYLDAGHSLPLVRGAFVAHPDVDDLLRQTEPKAHDCWDTEASVDGIHPDATSVARAVTERVKRAVNDFRKALRPPVPDRREAQLPDLENALKHLFGYGNSKRERPPSFARDVVISILEQGPEIDPTDPTQIRLRARVAYRLDTDQVSAPALLRMRYKFVEDNRSGPECALHIKPPPGFLPDSEMPGAFRGILGKTDVIFEICSAAYHPDWSGRLVAAGDIQVTGGGDHETV